MHAVWMRLRSHAQVHAVPVVALCKRRLLRAAWEDSSAPVDAWNRCAGAAQSSTLVPAVTGEKPYVHSFYDNREEPWGVEDGSVGPEDDPRWGAWANGFHWDPLY